MKSNLTPRARKLLTEKRTSDPLGQPEVRCFLDVFEKNGNEGQRLLAQHYWMSWATNRARTEAFRLRNCLKPSYSPADEAAMLRAGAAYVRCLADIIEGRAAFLAFPKADYPRCLPKHRKEHGRRDPLPLINLLLIRYLRKVRNANLVMGEELPNVFERWNDEELKAIARKRTTKRTATRNNGNLSVLAESSRKPQVGSPLKPPRVEDDRMYRRAFSVLDSIRRMSDGDKANTIKTFVELLDGGVLS